MPKLPYAMHEQADLIIIGIKIVIFIPSVQSSGMNNHVGVGVKTEVVI